MLFPKESLKTMLRRNVLPLTLFVIASLVAACSGGASGSAASTAAPTHASAATEAGTPASVRTSAAASSDAIHLKIVVEGTEARYRVREQLAQLSLPSDAIGKTSAVSGTVVINPDGTIVPDLSKIVVDVTGLTSDKGQRDRFVQRNLLDTGQYPTAEFDPTSVSGLAAPLPNSGPVTFQISGNLTAHGTTKPATWAVTGQILNSKEMTGTATTSFTFEDYGIQQPRVPVVLSVVDKITLELDFHLAKASY
jgi:polyisoprenoid-binding protein YceI